MQHPIVYNSQRDNFDYAGKFKGSWQCFSTCAWMFMSFYNPLIDAADDGGLARYLDDVEDSIGQAGIGEVIKQRYNWIKGGSSYWWLVQQAGIQKWLNADGVDGKVIFSERNYDFSSLPTLLNEGPVILNTSGMGGTRGHIILAVGYNDGITICHDPYGDARTNYSSDYGEALFYENDFLVKYTGQKIICIHLKK